LLKVRKDLPLTSKKLDILEVPFHGIFIGIAFKILENFL